MIAEVIRFECLVQDYPTCRDFGKIYTSLSWDPPTLLEGFTIINGFLFRRTRLCNPNTSLQDHLIWEIHAEGVVGHFDRDKTIALVEDRFYWPSVKRNLVRVVTLPSVSICQGQETQHRALHTFAYFLCTLGASQCGFHFRAPSHT